MRKKLSLAISLGIALLACTALTSCDDEGGDSGGSAKTEKGSSKKGDVVIIKPDDLFHKIKSTSGCEDILCSIAKKYNVFEKFPNAIKQKEYDDSVKAIFDKNIQKELEAYIGDTVTLSHKVKMHGVLKSDLKKKGVLCSSEDLQSNMVGGNNEISFSVSAEPQTSNLCERIDVYESDDKKFQKSSYLTLPDCASLNKETSWEQQAEQEAKQYLEGKKKAVLLETKGKTLATLYKDKYTLKNSSGKIVAIFPDKNSAMNFENPKYREADGRIKESCGYECYEYYEYNCSFDYLAIRKKIVTWETMITYIDAYQPGCEIYEYIGPAQKAATPAAKQPAQETPSESIATAADYSAALQTHFSKGTLGESSKSRPIEMFFQSVSKNGNSYSISGKSKTKSAEDTFSGTLTVSSETAGASCASGETEIKGAYDLSEAESKTSGHFVGSFTACESGGKLSKASFKGNWIKHANNKETPCGFEL